MFTISSADKNTEKNSARKTRWNRASLGVDADAGFDAAGAGTRTVLVVWGRTMSATSCAFLSNEPADECDPGGEPDRDMAKSWWP